MPPTPANPPGPFAPAQTIQTKCLISVHPSPPRTFFASCSRQIHVAVFRVHNFLDLYFPYFQHQFRQSPESRSPPRYSLVWEAGNLPASLFLFPMSSQKRIEANRLNAQKSTGPRSVEGKAASRMNALKSGIDAQSEIIPGEAPAALDVLTAEYLDSFRPATPQERVQVDILIRADWQLRRLARAEAQLWSAGYQDLTIPEQENATGRIFYNLDSAFVRLQRRIDATQRSYRAALKQLESLQVARHAEPAPDLEHAPDDATQSTSPETTYPSIGFVPQIAAEPRQIFQIDDIRSQRTTQ